MNFSQMIESTRERVRNTQATYSKQDWKLDRVKKPLAFYIFRIKENHEQFRDQRILLERGKVVWGSIVQANGAIFDPQGRFQEAGAAIMYSEDPFYDQNLDQLRAHAHNLYALKGQECSADMQAFSDKLADEKTADTKLAIPTGFTEGHPCFYATIMIFRKHLPVNYLANGYFPVLIAPEETDAVMILPHWYWDTALTQAWLPAPASSSTEIVQG